MNLHELHEDISAKHNALVVIALLLGAPVQLDDMQIGPADDLLEMGRKQDALIAAVGGL